MKINIEEVLDAQSTRNQINKLDIKTLNGIWTERK